MKLRAGLVALLMAGTASGAEPLRIATANFPENYGNPFNSVSVTYGTTYSALFDPLTFVTSDGEVLPWLAESWQQEAPNRWVFTLREGVTFSNGAPLTAAAVVTAIDYLKTDPARRDAVARDLSHVVKATARDARTVAIETRAPDPMLPRELSLLRLIEPGAWSKMGAEAFFRDPVGTGPYRLVKRTPTLATFARVAGSWRKGPAETLEVRVTLDPAARRAALQSGRVDVVNTAIAPDEIAGVEASGGSVFADRLPSVVAIALNNVKPGPLQDKRVRQALNYAVDKDAINRVLWGGRTATATQMAPAGAFGFNKALAPYPYDPAKAKTLLADAGYAEGFSFVFEGVIGTVIQSDIFQKVADDLAKIGVSMSIQMIPNAKFLESAQTGQWRGTAAALPYYSPTFDPLYAMATQICTSPAPWFCDREITTLVETARSTPDLDTRRALTEQIMAASRDAAPGIFLYDSVTFVGLGPRIARYRQDFGFIRYEDIVLR